MLIFFFFLMIPPPPISTPTYTLFPYATLFRSIPANMSEAAGWAAPLRVVITACDGVQPFPAWNEVKRMFVPYLITYDNRSPRDYVPIYRLMQSWRAVRLAESDRKSVG